MDYEKRKIDLRAKLIVDLKEFMSLKKLVNCSDLKMNLEEK